MNALRMVQGCKLPGKGGKNEAGILVSHPCSDQDELLIFRVLSDSCEPCD